jgi:hypothetical protein
LKTAGAAAAGTRRALSARRRSWRRTSKPHVLT